MLALIIANYDQLSGKSTGANDVSFTETIGGINFVSVSANKVLFDGVMTKGGDSGHNFMLKLRPIEGQVGTFYFFADKGIKSGVKLAVGRKDGEIRFKFTINDKSQEFVPQEISQDEEIFISVDIHNDHGDAHLLMWHGDGPYGDDEECEDYDVMGEDERCLFNNAYYDGRDDQPDWDWGDHGKGPGVYWGFEGDKDMIIELIGPLEAKSDA